MKNNYMNDPLLNKKSIKTNILLLVIYLFTLATPYSVSAQCPLVPTACSGTPVSGAANVTIPAGTTYYIPVGQTLSGNVTFASGTSKLCIQGTWTGKTALTPPAGSVIDVYGVVNSSSNWAFTGGGAAINIYSGATFGINNFHVTVGTYTITNCGTLTTNFDISSSGGVLTIDNYGVTDVKGSITSSNPNFTFNNKPGAAMYVGVNFNFSSGIYINDGDFCVRGDTRFSGGVFTNNKCLSTLTYNISGSNAFVNNYSITVNGNYSNSGLNTLNNGKIIVNGKFTNTGIYVLGTGSSLTCIDWTNSNTITGPGSGCGLFTVSGFSSNTGTFTAGSSARVDFFDIGNPSPKGSPPAKMDFNNGNVNSTTFTGTCVASVFTACNTQCPLFSCLDVANAGADQTVCATSATLAGNTSTSGIGIWTLVSGSGTITSPNTYNSSVTGLGLGANIFRWTLTCNGSTDDVTITRTATPTTSNAGPNQAVCATTATLAGNTATDGIGTWTLISGSGTITTPSSPTSGVTGLGVGANVFRWTIANAPCAASTSEVTITRSATPTTSNAGTNQTVCATTAALAGNTPTVGTGTWTLVSGSGTITTPGSQSSGVTGLGVGANTFRWTITNAPCSPSTDDVIITRSAIPTTANAGPDQSLCNVTTATLAGNTATAGTGTWTLVSGSGTITTPSSPTSGLTGLGIGANVFRWTVSNAPCTASFDDVTITIKGLPTVANAGPNQSVCATNAIMAGNTPTVGIGTWTLVSGSGTPSSPNSPTSSVTGLTPGTNVFRWTISNPPCASTTSDVTINVSATPSVADAGLDQSLCNTFTATLAGNTPTSGVGGWSLISGSGTVTNPASPTSGVTGLGIGANTFRWTINGGACANLTDDITINVNALPTTSNAGSDQLLCTSNTSLAGNIPVVGAGVWTRISGSGNIITPTSPNSGVTGLGIGANVFRWTITNAPCSPSTDNVVITVSDIPTISAAGPDQTVCFSSPTATLAGNNPTVGTGTWTLISGSGTITTPTLRNTTVTGLGVGTNVFRWTISNAPCATSFDEVSVIVEPLPTTANAGPDQNQTVCITNPDGILAGNTPIIGTGIWTRISGTGTITNPTSPTSSVTGLSVGVNVFRWTINNAPCAASFDEITINVSNIPTIANAGPDQLLCITSPTTTLAGNNPTVGTGTWTLVSGSGTITTPSSRTSGVTGLGVGANVFRWTINNPPCAVSTDEVTINVSNVSSTADAGPDQLLCANLTLLNAATPVSGTGVWTIVSGTATIANPSNPTSALTGFSVGTTTLRWTVTNSPCAPTFDDVNIVVSNVPTTADAGQDQTICTTSATLNGVTPTFGIGTWTLVSGSGTITSPNSPNSGVTGLAVGANVFRWSINNSPCPLSTDEVTINVSANPSSSNAGIDQNICFASPTATLNGNNPAIGTGTWTLVSGSGTITNPSLRNTTVTSLGVGANVFRWTIGNSPCATKSDDVIINVSNIPTTSNAGPDQTICSSSATLAGNPPTVGVGTWTLISGSGTIANPTLRNSGVMGLGVGANVFRWTITNAPCAPSIDEITINVSGVPTVSNAGSDQNLCTTSPTTTLAGNAPTVGTGVWTRISGTGTITTPTSPTSGVTGLGIGANVFRWTITNSPCPPSTDEVTITVKALPTVAVAGSNQTVCATTAVLAGNTPTVGTGTWTLVSGTGTINNPTSPTSSLSGLAVGANVFRWTISNPPCSSTSSDVTITVSPNPTTSDAGPDQLFCSTVTSSTLAGNTPAAGTGTWTLISGTGVIANPSLPNSGVTGLTVGANVFRWTINSGACANVKDEVTITISEPITIANSITDVACYGDSTGVVNITVSGGNIPYTFNWSNSGTTEDINGLKAGTYSVSVTDLIGCIKTANYSVIEPNSPIQITLSSTPVSCKGTADGTTTVLASGGTPTFTYSWSPSGGTNSIETGLAGGTYTVSVNDSHACALTGTVVVDESVALLSASITKNKAVTCKGSSNGLLTVTALNGTSPYSYSWSPSGGSADTALSLSGGIYTVTISDMYGCTTTTAATVKESTSPLIGYLSANTPVSCKGSSDGFVTAAPVGGTMPYTFSWSPIGVTSATASGLSGGTYTVSVTDLYGCDTVMVATIFESTTKLNASVTSAVPVSCKGSNDGKAGVSAIGGTDPYTYLWSPLGGTADTASGLPGGAYTILITDSTGCDTTLTVTINESTTSLTASITNSNDVTCKGSNDGGATVAASGGTIPYTYLWLPNGATTTTATGLAGGIYTIQVNDTYGCSTTTTVTINESTIALTASIVSTDAACNSKNGTVTVIDSGGTAPITYLWSPSISTTSSASGLGGGTYMVTVTDVYGCAIALSTTVNAPPSPTASFTPSTNGGSNPLIVSFVNNSTGGTYYKWIFGDGTQDTVFAPVHVYDNKGRYQVMLIVTNSFGCIDTAIYGYIEVIQKSSISIPNVFTPNNDGQNDIFYITSVGLVSLNIEIYNRWGMKIYEYDTVNGTWDGRTVMGLEAPDGTYYYILKALGEDKAEYSKQGFITLIR